MAGVAAFLIVSALTRKLCSEAREASKDDTLMLDNCAKALGNAGELTEAEALAVKKDRLVPEDTRNLKMCLPEIRSIIESERGNAVAAVDLLSPVSHRSSRMAGKSLPPWRNSDWHEPTPGKATMRTAAKPTMISSPRGKTRTRISQYSGKPKPNIGSSAQPHQVQLQRKAIAPRFSEVPPPQLMPFARPVDGFSRLFVRSAAAFSLAFVP